MTPATRAGSGRTPARCARSRAGRTGSCKADLALRGLGLVPVTREHVRRTLQCTVAAWLLGIIVNLVGLGEYYDIALRDFGLLVAALALARLATSYGRGRTA